MKASTLIPMLLAAREPMEPSETLRDYIDEAGLNAFFSFALENAGIDNCVVHYCYTSLRQVATFCGKGSHAIIFDHGASDLLFDATLMCASAYVSAGFEENRIGEVVDLAKRLNDCFLTPYTIGRDSMFKYMQRFFPRPIKDIYDPARGYLAAGVDSSELVRKVLREDSTLVDVRNDLRQRLLTALMAVGAHEIAHIRSHLDPGYLEAYRTQVRTLPKFVEEIIRVMAPDRPFYPTETKVLSLLKSFARESNLGDLSLKLIEHEITHDMAALDILFDYYSAKTDLETMQVLERVEALRHIVFRFLEINTLMSRRKFIETFIGSTQKAVDPSELWRQLESIDNVTLIRNAFSYFYCVVRANANGTLPVRYMEDHFFGQASMSMCLMEWALQFRDVDLGIIFDERFDKWIIENSI